MGEHEPDSTRQPGMEQPTNKSKISPKLLENLISHIKPDPTVTDKQRVEAGKAAETMRKALAEFQANATAKQMKEFKEGMAEAFNSDPAFRPQIQDADGRWIMPETSDLVADNHDDNDQSEPGTPNQES